MDSEEVPTTPTRRVSRRIQAKAEQTLREITPEPVKKTRRSPSRSRSVTRNISTDKENVEKKPTLEIVEDEVKEESVVKPKEPKSPGRKRGDRSRSTTPTRILPARAAAKSPARDPTTPVRLTRSARRQGYATPDQSEQVQLVIAESPQTLASSETTEEQLVIFKTPKLILEDVRSSKTPMIQRFLKNWKGIQLNESVQEEPMEVSYAEEVVKESQEEYRAEDSTELDRQLDQKEETEHSTVSEEAVTESTVPQNEKDEQIMEKEEKVEGEIQSETVVMETVILCKPRVLKMEYSPPVQFPERSSGQDQEGEDDNRVSSTDTIVQEQDENLTEHSEESTVAEKIVQFTESEERETRLRSLKLPLYTDPAEVEGITIGEAGETVETGSLVVEMEPTVGETETDDSSDCHDGTEGETVTVPSQVDDSSEQKTTATETTIESSDFDETEGTGATVTVLISTDENEDKQSTMTLEQSTSPETETCDSCGNPEETKGMNMTVSSLQEEEDHSSEEGQDTEAPVQSLREALKDVSSVNQSPETQIKDEHVSPMSFRKIGSRESVETREEDLVERLGEMETGSGDFEKLRLSEKVLPLEENTEASKAPKSERKKKRKKTRTADGEEETVPFEESVSKEVPILEDTAESVPKSENSKKKRQGVVGEPTEPIEKGEKFQDTEAPALQTLQSEVPKSEKRKKKRMEAVENLTQLEELLVLKTQQGEAPKTEKRKTTTRKKTLEHQTAVEEAPVQESHEEAPENFPVQESLKEAGQMVEEADKRKKKKKRTAAVVEVHEEKENLEQIPASQSGEVVEPERKKKKKKKAQLEEAPFPDVVKAQEEVNSVSEGEKKKKKKKKILTESNIEKEIEPEDKKEKKQKRKFQQDSQESKTTKNGKKKAKKMVDLDEEASSDPNGSSSGLSYPEVTLKRMFNNPKEVSTELKDLLQSLYAWNNRLEKRTDDLPDKFLNDDSETIWQFVNHKNGQINKDWRKYKNLLDEPAAVDGLGLSDGEEDEEEEEPLDEDFEDDDELQADEAEEIEDNEDAEQDVDLFNLKDEDLKDLERELEAERDSGEGTSDEREKENDRPRKTKKYPKSAVDDKFFNLAEMDAFCDEAEKEDDEEGLLATVDDTWGGPANYRYEDFFGKLDDVVGGGKGGEDKKGKKRKVEASVSKDAKKKKSVRFALDEEEEEPEDDEETPQDDETAHPVLLGEPKEDEKMESKLKTDIRKLQESIRRLEEENLEPRSWELSGEVSAQQRSENELLETHLQFDNANKRAPEVTEDFTEKLEAMIKQRIRDQAFDDVLRIKKVDEKVEVYRNDAIEEQEMMKKSLTEVYEKDYQKAAGATAATATENPVHKGIQEKVDRLFHLIDAMSHFEYSPPTVRPEVKVVSNMAALRVEEVGIQASTDAQLLAPEEMKKKQKGELKAGDERSKTDKLRERRKKKTKQRAMVIKVGAEKALSGQLAAKIKKTKVPKADKEENLKSSNFFSKLQDTVQKEIKEKTTKKKKVKSLKVAVGGSKFKL